MSSHSPLAHSVSAPQSAPVSPSVVLGSTWHVSSSAQESPGSQSVSSSQRSSPNPSGIHMLPVEEAPVDPVEVPHAAAPTTPRTPRTPNQMNRCMSEAPLYTKRSLGAPRACAHSRQAKPASRAYALRLFLRAGAGAALRGRLVFLGGGFSAGQGRK